MFSIDDRAGNVMTTVALFAVGAVIVYVARGSFFILLLSLLFAYLLEPAVTFIQRHSRLGRGSRTWAITQVYLIGTLVVVSFGYALAPHVARQMKALNAAVPQILQDLSTGRAASTLGGRHGLSTAQQLWLQDWMARHHDLVARVFERGAMSVEYVVANAIWLFLVPILAIFLLNEGRSMADTMIASLRLDAERTLTARILRRVDTMLAGYVRAQLALAALSFLFYTICMAFLGFPYAIALGLLGGTLEFLPVAGWLVAAAVILPIGFFTHSHWIWMAGLLVAWRFVQSYVNSPRIMGDKLELRPLTVIFVLMVGGQVGGIAGLYISVPAAAVLRIVAKEFLSSRQSSTAHSDESTLKAKA